MCPPTSSALTVSLAAALLVLALACNPSAETGTAEGGKPADAAPTGGQAPGEPTEPSYRLAELLPYGGEPFPEVFTAGQPSTNDLRGLVDHGVTAVVNLRYPTERGVRSEIELIGELGLDYIAIPVRGSEGLTRENALALDTALAEAEGPVLVHCGSSNRVGGLFALRAFYLKGASIEEALSVGRSAGLTRLEPAVREILESASVG